VKGAYGSFITVKDGAVPRYWLFPGTPIAI
jgi:hypothetical protein